MPLVQDWEPVYPIVIFVERLVAKVVSSEREVGLYLRRIGHEEITEPPLVYDAIGRSFALRVDGDAFYFDILPSPECDELFEKTVEYVHDYMRWRGAIWRDRSRRIAVDLPERGADISELRKLIEEIGFDGFES